MPLSVGLLAAEHLKSAHAEQGSNIVDDLGLMRRGHLAVNTDRVGPRPRVSASQPRRFAQGSNPTPSIDAKSRIVTLGLIAWQARVRGWTVTIFLAAAIAVIGGAGL